jgi:hypothetical protein
LEDQDIDWRIILRWIFDKWCGKIWTGLVWLRIWTSGICCKCGNELLSSIKCGEFFEELKTF